MAAGDLLTGGEWEIEYRGLLVGGDTEYALVQDNLGSHPSVRASSFPKLNGHGNYKGDTFIGPRLIQLTFEVVSSLGPESIGAAVETLKQAFVPATGEQTMVIKHRAVADSTVVTINAETMRLAYDSNIEFYEGITIVTVELEATDPRFYAKTLNTVSSVGLEAASEGLTWPLTWPLDWGSVASSQFQAVNNGNFPAEPVFTIAGPIVRPRIENLTQNKTMQFDITLVAGETLTVDMGTNEVTVNNANRYNTIVSGSEWFTLGNPGDTIRFRAASGTGTLSASWASSWI